MAIALAEPRGHRAVRKRWFRAFMELLPVAHDAMLSDDRGRAVGVLTEMLPFETAVHLTGSYTGMRGLLNGCYVGAVLDDVETHFFAQQLEPLDSRLYEYNNVHRRYVPMQTVDSRPMNTSAPNLQQVPRTPRTRDPMTVGTQVHRSAMGDWWQRASSLYAGVKNIRAALLGLL